MRKKSFYETGEFVKKGTLMIGIDTDHNITRGKIYVAQENQGHNTFHECVFVINDEGQLADYSSEFFMPYDGETVDI